MRDSRPFLFPTDFPALARSDLKTLQINLGYRCNQQCQHCHVNASPSRTEMMSTVVMADVIKALSRLQVKQLDLTGGAPELHPQFKYLVKTARALGIHVQDRCNLSILFEPDQTNLAEFLAENQVEIFASMPCYLEENVDTQRGYGAYQASIKGLQLLNSLGYGAGGNLRLNLVYNPIGAHLPPPQVDLMRDYKTALAKLSIVFDQLYTICNMPIQRFGGLLLATGEFDNYLNLLKQAHSLDNLETVMCRNLLSVDWQGYLYDCDFNQLLDLKLQQDQQALHIRNLDLSQLENKTIQVGEHCYGCTAGQGSSCGGALL